MRFFGIRIKANAALYDQGVRAQGSEEEKTGVHGAESRSGGASGPAAALGLVLLPVVVLYGALLRAARAVPMADDFWAILRFSLQWKAQPTAAARVWMVLASQHNEYKLVFEHALVALDLATTGRVQLRLLIWVGNLLLLGVGWLLWRHCCPEQTDRTRRLLMFAPMAWLLFQMNYVENLDWAMCGLQTIPVLLFSLGALHWVLRRGRGALLWACGCAVLACMSSGNGFLMAPVGLLWLARERRWRGTVAWCASYAAALAAYLYRYHRFTPPGYDAHVPLGAKVVFFLSFLGAAAENMHHVPMRGASVVLGLLLLAGVVMGFARRCAVGDAFWLGVAAWCVLTALVVTQGRIGEGRDLALTLRYKVYSDLLLIVCYALAMSWVMGRSGWTSRKKAAAYVCAMAAVAALVAVSDVYGYRFLTVRARVSMAAMERFAMDPARNTPVISATGLPLPADDSEFARKTLIEALVRGVYSLPPDIRR